MALRRRRPTLPVIVVSGQVEPGTVRAVLDTGAAGCALKTGAAETLLLVAGVVASGGVYVPPHALLACIDGGALGAPIYCADAAPSATCFALLMDGEPNSASRSVSASPRGP